MKQHHHPRQILEKLVNKNAIKPKIRGPLAIFPESLDPTLGGLTKTLGAPSLGFSNRVHLWLWSKPPRTIMALKTVGSVLQIQFQFCLMSELH